MPDPVWTAEYDFSSTPEANGFTRVLYNTPTLTLVTSGSPANRRVEVNSDQGSVVFVTSSIPSFDDSVGATGEAGLAVSGTGDAGFEMTFLNRAMLIQIFQSSLLVTLAGDTGEQNYEFVTGDNTANTLWRATYQSGQLRVYRAGVLVAGPLTVPVAIKPFQRFLWWGEGGGAQVFRKLVYYVGGAVAP